MPFYPDDSKREDLNLTAKQFDSFASLKCPLRNSHEQQRPTMSTSHTDRNEPEHGSTDTNHKARSKENRLSQDEIHEIARSFVDKVCSFTDQDAESYTWRIHADLEPDDPIPTKDQGKVGQAILEQLATTLKRINQGTVEASPTFYKIMERAAESVEYGYVSLWGPLPRSGNAWITLAALGILRSLAPKVVDWLGFGPLHARKGTWAAHPWVGIRPLRRGGSRGLLRRL